MPVCVVFFFFLPLLNCVVGFALYQDKWNVTFHAVKISSLMTPFFACVDDSILKLY